MSRFVIVQNSVRTTYIFRAGYIRSLLKHGEVVLIAPNDDCSAKQKLQNMGVKVYSISSSKILSIFQMNALILSERFKGSTFICHFIITFLSCYLTLVPFNTKLVVYIEGLGSIFSKEGVWCSVLGFLLRNCRAQRLFCNNSERDLVGIGNDHVTHGIGIDISKFSRKTSIASGGIFKLLFVGRLINDKGVNDLIDAFRIITNTRNDVSLTLVGDIYPNNPSSLNKDDIENLKKEFGRFIEFIGFSENIEDWYTKSDILVLPSKREGFPVCVMEASACGIPTVGYNVPGINDAIVPGTNGELVEYGKVLELSAKIESLLNEEILADFISSASKFAGDEFCFVDKNKNLVNILTSLTDNR